MFTVARKAGYAPAEMSLEHVGFGVMLGEDGKPNWVSFSKLGPRRAVLNDLSPAYDWNCPQHITPRFTLAEIEAGTQALRSRIIDLEAEVERLKHDC